MEVALSAVGALLPTPEEVAILEDRPAADVNELARRDLPGSKHFIERGSFDEHMGGDW
jgi:hypothetical protein